MTTKTVRMGGFLRAGSREQGAGCVNQVLEAIKWSRYRWSQTYRPRVRKYKTLVAWQRARELSLLAFEATSEAYHPRSRALLDQLRRAALSVELNIVEGYALGSRPQFLRHLRIAIGSAAETECAIELARKLEYLPRPTTDRLTRLVDEILACSHGLVRRLRRP
ncbi:MAG: four helix bundle protein [Gemmatimonadales bacterium]